MKNSGRCFLCLQKGHRLRDCKSNDKCFKCNERNNHHISICSETNYTKVETKEENQQKNCEPHSTNACQTNVNFKNILLQAAEAQVSNPKLQL